MLRGEVVDPATVAGLPDVFELPYELAPWEPAYALAEYRDAGAEFPAPPAASGFVEVADGGDGGGGGGGTVLDDDAVELAVRQLVEPWTTSSNGHAEVVAVDGDATSALRALGVRHARIATLTVPEAVSWLAWGGASGGAFGRRRGAAAGRFGALWVVAALADAMDDWPLTMPELGTLAGELRWAWWDAHEPPTGWQLQLVVEDVEDGLAWAINARDAT